MSIDRSELACYEYINAIKDIKEFEGLSLYNLDKFRTKLHDELCTLFNLSKKSTKKVTDNIDLSYSKCAEKLYIDLLYESRRQNEKAE